MYAACRLKASLLVLVTSAGCGASAAPDSHDTPERAPTVSTSVQGLTVADCPAGTRIIQGTAGSDRLIGTSGSDCMLGGGGDDTLYGNGGHDFLVGGDGNDVMYGGGGNDAAYGEAGNDTLYGDAGADILDAGDGDDTVRGGIGNDQIQGGSGTDALYGDESVDTIRGGAEADLIHGGAGNDLLYGDDGDDVLDGDENGDQQWGGAGDDVLYGDIGNDKLYGDAGDDALVGGTGTNVVDGGAGTDACSGVSCEKPALAVSGCTQDSQCASSQHCIVDVGLCLGCVSDQDGDTACDSQDGCPTDVGKVAPGLCGCGVSEDDRDLDGTPDCLDACPDDAAKTAAGACGCGMVDVDTDADGTPDCQDSCPTDAAKLVPGACGCGAADVDTDSDGLLDCVDACPGFDDAIDENANGEPDGCEIPTDCTWNTVGRGVFRGDVWITDEVGIAQLAGTTCITGSLRVYNTALTNLTGLEALTSVAGRLEIDSNYMLNTVDGLDGLTRVGGLFVLGNAALTSLSGLDGLISVEGTVSIVDNAQLGDVTALYGVTELDILAFGGFYVSDNPTLPACQVWTLADMLGTTCEAPSCQNNTGSGSCGELPDDFACVTGASGPGVWNGSLVIDSNHMPNLSGVTCVTGDLWITESSLANLSDFSTLQQVGGRLAIVANPSLHSLQGLEKLTYVADGLAIERNPVLADTTALGRLTRIDEIAPGYRPAISIRDNASLAQCDAWTIAGRAGRSCVPEMWVSGSDDYCSNNTGTTSCPLLPDDFECVPGAKGPGVHDGRVFAYSNPDALSGVRCVTGDLELTGLTNLSSLRSLQKVGGRLSLTDATVEHVDELANLTEIGRGLRLESNAQLESLAGLRNLRDVGASSSSVAPLSIHNNPSLSACWVWMVEAQTGRLCSAGGYECSNGTTGSCGELPADFDCVPGAEGPGVFEGDVYADTHNAARYSGITCATGNVIIVGADLPYLRSLQKVAGDLTVHSPQDVDDLARLAHVGGIVNIEYNDTISDLSGLSALRDTELNIHHNRALPGCWIWSLTQQTGNYTNGYFYANEGTTSCGTYPADFACVPGATGPGVYDGDVEEWNPGDLGGLRCITGNLTLEWSYSSDLTRFGQLQAVGGSVRIANSDYLTSLDGLDQLTAIGGSLTISDNTALENLGGLSSLSSLGGALEPGAEVMSIANNGVLPACWVSAIENQTTATCGGNAECSGNAGQGTCPPVDFACVPGAMGPGVYDGDVTQWEPPDLSHVRCVTGNVTVSGSEGTDLTRFQWLQAVGGTVSIVNNHHLTSLDGLDRLTKIGGYLHISDNAALENLGGLSSLSSLGGALEAGAEVMWIVNNGALPACWVTAIEEQTSVTCDRVYECYGNAGQGSCTP